MAMTHAQLAQLKEAEDKVEFKAAKNDYSFAGGNSTNQAERRKCVLGYIVALANEGGGMLVFGMADKHPHTVVGTQFAIGKVGALENEIYNRLEIRVKIEEIIENELRVVVINIPSRPVGKTLKFEGVALMRIGDSLRNMSDDEMLKILSEQEPDFSAKICVGLTLSDLDSEAVEKMKTAYSRKQSNPSFSSLPNEQILSDLKLFLNGNLNYAALVLLGKEDVIEKYLPQAKTICEFRYNESQIAFDFRESIGGPLFIAIDKIWSWVNSKNGNIPIRAGAYIFNVNAFNEDVTREALLNAITHRDYSINSEVVIKQYPKKLVINNPGGFPKGVTLQNILTVSSTPRSRTMAEVLEKTGLVERSGQGVDKIFAITLQEGKPEPDYNHSDAFQVTLQLLGDIEDKAFNILINKIQSERPDNQKLSVEQIVALHRIKRGLFAQVNPQTLSRLESEGLIARAASHTNRYTLRQDYYQLSDSVQRIKNRYTVKEVTLVVLALQANKIAIKELENKLAASLNRNQIKFLIKKLIDDEVIVAEGAAKGTKYKLSQQFESYKGDILVNEIISKLQNDYDPVQ